MLNLAAHWLALVLAGSSPAAAEPSVLLAAMGDIQLGRSMPAAIKAHGAAWLWDGVRDALRPADLRFGNLECPVTTAGRPTPKPLCFRADPGQARAALAAGGIGVVSVANNHSYDWGREGLRQTAAHLADDGVAAPGIGLGRAGAIAPSIVTCRALKVAFVAYTDVTPETYLPADDDACVATIEDDMLASEIRHAKALGDVLVVSVHWGEEYRGTPTARQRALAHAMVDAGADAVLGHHPHVVQPTEVYGGKPICYSLGTCLFDRSSDRFRDGMIAWLRLTPGHAVLERSTALRIDDPRPVLLPGDEP